jgi:predicted enzyme related to lactoylglutathione lyase
MTEVSSSKPEIVIEIGIDCADLEMMAKFWSATLGYRSGVVDIERYAEASAIYYSLIDPAGRRPKIILQRVPEAKSVKNRLHLDLHVVDIDAESVRLVRLGAQRIELTPISEAGVVWIRLMDPEGNEFCLVQK